ncbi:methionine--tRNA ligase [Candidatus Kaiserbacteria bacterium CG10_big_fil_rev_8_21_14_0_10_49_17]|uniref:Methionine--tRNA ligase n=1 Tax=Candidatus Kaiserbacteria bacterium CG10_big_fil_rev_8_21_14_0_10_49_17 TaxID=1974609 RepID=A0A2M6WDU7_9BACT|nr:MAG: methionine--tRNA ligase [Candidatus Kaiserbacteria bacterium CG10_big_fil_rev_8_21_14_0_10_49_17]
MAENRYITTTLPYVNDVPHIGHALEFVQADTLARFWRLVGDNVFFNTGTDEHGQKIFDEAQKAGEDVHAYVDRYAKTFLELGESLNLSYDRFIRTTEEGHCRAAQELWKRCDAKGDIEMREFEGLYCIGCEKYLTERDLENGKCPLHPNREPETVKEENYFFKLSNYQSELLAYLSVEGAILPEWRREEAVQFVKNGLEDFSISRNKERMSWGVPVPGDDSQVMYVWFDALTNYISTLDWPREDGKFKTFWSDGKTLQLAGKDQVRFQSIMWQAMLLSADIKPTDTIFYHGFINSGGQKMSKSLGNVIGPKDLVERYGTDATRFLLLRHVHPFEDTDITWERLDEWYTADLVNGLGNLVSRIMKLAQDNLDAPIEKPAIGSFENEYTGALESFRFDQAADHVWKRISALDARITETEPFKLVRSNPEAGKVLIAEMVEELYRIGRLLYPLLPEANTAIKEAVLENKKPENLFPRLA